MCPLMKNAGLISYHHWNENFCNFLHDIERKHWKKRISD
ncbi:hypothetical protein S7335_3842 [Synechococcus sp. PCC 7335]|nr:hypothetical protein S7335_3842 [Synechococcus sp. PCC 7335]